MTYVGYCFVNQIILVPALQLNGTGLCQVLSQMPGLIVMAFMTGLKTIRYRVTRKDAQGSFTFAWSRR